MAEIKVTDLAEETAESLDGSESFVMFDTTSGKRGTVASIGAYILSKLTTKLGGISRTVSAAIESIESTLSAHASAISSKQDKLTFDSAPASGSKNPVTSGGIYSALIGKQNAGDYATTSALAKKQDKLTYDSTPTSGSGNPVTSGGVASALAKKQDTIGASTALAAASLAVTGNVAGATFNGHALGDLLLVKLFKGSVTSTSTSGEIFIPYTVPDGYKTLGALYARPLNFVGGAYSAFVNPSNIDCWYFNAPSNSSVQIGAYLLFVRDI